MGGILTFTSAPKPSTCSLGLPPGWPALPHWEFPLPTKEDSWGRKLCSTPPPSEDSVPESLGANLLNLLCVPGPVLGAGALMDKSSPALMVEVLVDGA